MSKQRLEAKFATTDERYFERRHAYSRDVGEQELWDIADHWPLYAGVANIARYLTIADLLRSTLRVPGHVAEFGTYRGSTLMLLAKLLRIHDAGGPKMLHCFDSFRGLTEFSTYDGDASNMEGAFTGSRENLERIIDLYEMRDEIEIHEGLIEETLPDLLMMRPELSFSFVYCDTDLYESTALILDRIWPRVMPGGVIAFDEWNFEIWPGEGIAVNDFLASLSVTGDQVVVEAPPNTRQPSLVIRKR